MIAVEMTTSASVNADARDTDRAHESPTEIMDLSEMVFGFAKVT
jgi:hypothetical protein